MRLDLLRKIASCLVVLAVSAGAALAQSGNAPARPKGKPPAEAEKKPVKEKIFPLKSSWVAVSLAGKSLGSGAERPTFLLDDHLRARGFSGCNNYSATMFPLRENRLGVGPIALTRKACPKPIMDRERDFLLAIKASQAWDMIDGALIFKSSRGDIRFERVL
jgi:heat shock protein HslJ